MKKAIIITENNYPEGDAGAVRQHAFAKMLSEMDYDVLVIGYGKPTKGNVEIYDGIKYISFRENSNNKAFRIWNRMMFGNKFYKYIIKNYLELDLLFVVDLMPNAFKKIIKLKKKYNCTLIHDSVEWYSKEHFQKLANKTIRIPVIMDIKKIDFRIKVKPNDKIVFSYAGGPGKKDFLREIINGFALLNSNELKKIEINIIGVNKQQLINLCEVDEKAIDVLGTCLKIHGRVERSKAVDYIKNSDYSLLIRDENLRYAKAGFPTKIVESLACGTPPLCNYSSDLELYLEDKKNSIIANGHTSRDVYEAVKKALLITNENDRSLMRENSRKLALSSFDYSVYKDILSSICK